jgi:sulfur carrier protein
MKLTVNGKEVAVTTAGTLRELLAELQVESPDQVSVEVNGEIFDRAEFGSQTIKDGDPVEFLYFMGGGRGTF